MSPVLCLLADTAATSYTDALYKNNSGHPAVCFVCTSYLHRLQAILAINSDNQTTINRLIHYANLNIFYKKRFAKPDIHTCIHANKTEFSWTNVKMSGHPFLLNSMFHRDPNMLLDEARKVCDNGV